MDWIKELRKHFFKDSQMKMHWLKYSWSGSCIYPFHVQKRNGENKSEEKKKMKDEGRSPWMHADFRHNYDMMKAETWKWESYLYPAPHRLSLSVSLSLSSSGQQVVKLRSKQELKQVNKTKSAMLTCCEDERWLWKCTKKPCLCSQSVF